MLRGLQVHCAEGSTALPERLRAAQQVIALCMGQRLSSSSNAMATNVEKAATADAEQTGGEEKTFVCAVSTGS